MVSTRSGVTVFVFDGHLGLAVGPQKIDSPVFAYLASRRVSLWAYMMGIGISSGVSSVANPNINPWSPAPWSLYNPWPVLTPWAMSGLVVDAGDDRTGSPVKPHLGRVIADILDGFPHDLGHVDITLGGNFTGNKGQAGGDQGFAGHPAALVLGHDGIQDSVGNGIGDFVRMALGN
jgi:hypothetical protein